MFQNTEKNFFKRGFFGFFSFGYIIKHCFICRPSDSTVSEDAGIEPRNVATLALTARRSDQSAMSHPQSTEKLQLVEILL
jgi:hypothetical protein